MPCHHCVICGFITGSLNKLACSVSRIAMASQALLATLLLLCTILHSRYHTSSGCAAMYSGTPTSVLYSTSRVELTLTTGASKAPLRPNDAGK